MPRGLGDTAHQEMHVRLVNWGAWAAQGSGRRAPAQHALEVVEPDAIEMEAALLVMRTRRLQLYQYARWAYLLRWTDATLCREFRCSEAHLRAIRARTFEWLCGHMAGKPMAKRRGRPQKVA